MDGSRGICQCPKFHEKKISMHILQRWVCFIFVFVFLSNLMTPRRFLNTHLGASLGIADGSDGKEPTCSATDLGLTPGSGRAPGEGNG